MLACCFDDLIVTFDEVFLQCYKIILDARSWTEHKREKFATLHALGGV